MGCSQQCWHRSSCPVAEVNPQLVVIPALRGCLTYTIVRFFGDFQPLVVRQHSHVALESHSQNSEAGQCCLYIGQENAVTDFCLRLGEGYLEELGSLRPE